MKNGLGKMISGKWVRMGMVACIIAASIFARPLFSAPPDRETPQTPVPTVPVEPAPMPEASPTSEASPVPANPQVEGDAAAPTQSAKPALFDPNIPNLEENYPKPKPEYPDWPDDTSSLPPKKGWQDQLAESDEIKNSPHLLNPYSEWDLAGIQSPLFGTEEITEFSQRPLSLEGKWKVRPHFSLSTLYDGNILVQSTGEQSDFITVFSPGITVRIGNEDSAFYMVGDYTLGAVVYAQHGSNDTVNHNLKLDLQWRLPKTTFGLHVGVLDDTGTSIDVSNRVERQTYYLGLTTHHILGDKTSWDINADYNQNVYNGLISSTQTQAQTYFNYEYSPKTTVGVGGTVGFLNVEDAADQTFEQGSVRVTYRSSEKLTFIADCGFEVRQFGAGEGTAVSPIFSIKAAWAVREGTKLDFSLRRQNYASAILQDQNYAATSFDITVTQKFTDKVDLLLSGGYVNTDYSAAASGVTATREDNYFYIRPAVQWRLTNWLSLGLFYEYSQNDSSGEGARGFRRDRGGIQFAITF